MLQAGAHHTLSKVRNIHLRHSISTVNIQTLSRQQDHCMIPRKEPYFFSSSTAFDSSTIACSSESTILYGTSSISKEQQPTKPPINTRCHTTTLTKTQKRTEHQRTSIAGIALIQLTINILRNGHDRNSSLRIRVNGQRSKP